MLLLLPYGMCIRQILLNKELWHYLSNNYDIDLMSPIKFTENVGVQNIFDNNPTNLFQKFLKKISLNAAYALRASQMVNFFLDNDLGENFALRWRWFGDYARHLLVLSALNQFTLLNRLITKLLIFLASLYPTFFLRKNNYSSIIVTHVSDLDCTVMGLGANRLSIPLITITLGLDNYRHGPLLFKPDLMLLWGAEQEAEFKNYHLSSNQALLETKLKKIGSLIHDLYLENDKTDKRDYLFENYSLERDQEFILVPAMTEDTLPNQKLLCDILIDFLSVHDLNHKLIVRKLPQVDDDMWKDYEKRNSDRVVIQEPKSASFDKRSNNTIFSLDSAREDVGELVQTLKQCDLVISMYPSTLIIDAMLFEAKCAVAMFDWSNQDGIGGHPQEKFYLSKKYTHKHNRYYNLLYSKENLFKFMEEVLIQKKYPAASNNKLFMEISGESADGKSGIKAVEALTSFMKSL